MKKIKSKNTKSEVLLRSKLWSLGYRYRIHTDLIGKPDIVFLKKRIVIFVDGEFWHGKNWQIKKTKISNNKDYWIPKIEKNIARDQKVNKSLEELGFKVLRFWDSEVRTASHLCIEKIEATLNFQSC